MILLGNPIEDYDIIARVLVASEDFLSELLGKINSADHLDSTYAEKNKIPDADYYLIYNKFVIVGKKKIDKRVVRRVNRQEIIDELDVNWSPGLEPNFILLPIDSKLNFGIYIQDSIFYLERS